ncbi:MAG TPA: NADPH:quinone oxidoreductase family protein [Acidimicrobiia bacterium]|nr:NADPH:quinone oxidoreductase family protein [Acidimicrobiia bacterium]
MRALICDSYDGWQALRVGEMPDPEPLHGTALVRVEAAAVNFADLLVVAGQYQVKPELPFVPGNEFAGVVETADGVEGLSPGDRVCGFVGMGALAEWTIAYPGAIMPLPETIGFEEGAAIPVAYGTSYHALVDRAGLVEGETLLVLGAGGGVGISAVQIGKALGARVLAAVSSADKADAVRAAGADSVIRYDRVPLRDGIAAATSGGGVDVVYDPVGGAATEQAVRSTNWNGRVLVVGFASGVIPKIPLNLNLVKGNSVIGVFWGRFNLEEPERSSENNRRIMEWVADGTLRPLVQKTYPLADALEAMRWVAERKVIGRVVITPGAQH